MCDCKQKLEELMRYHKSCCRNVRYETITPIQKIIELPELSQEVVIPETPIIPPPSLEIIKEVVKEFIDEIQETSQEIQETSQDEPSIEYEEEDDTVELTDISPEELQIQEEEEKRIRDELALIELTKLTKKKVRSKK